MTGIKELITCLFFSFCSHFAPLNQILFHSVSQYLIYSCCYGNNFIQTNLSITSTPWLMLGGMYIQRQPMKICDIHLSSHSFHSGKIFYPIFRSPISLTPSTPAAAAASSPATFHFGLFACVCW
jgi:hypothetical protein